MADLASLDAPKRGSGWATVRNLFIHLRLHFQILLAPIFLWGYFLAGGQPDLKFWIAFLAFHLFLYGGTTAYNSYYDRDEGPVGGLVQPPPVLEVMLPFSLVLQAIGAVLAFMVNLPFAIIYLLIFFLFAAYSYPPTRLKSRPLIGLLTVGAGQGLLAALAGWVTANPDWMALPTIAWLGIGAVTLITIGFYPLTQIYQIEEDLARGDRTFAAWVGPRRVFLFAVVVQGLASVVLIFVINQLLGPLNALVVALFYGVLLAAIIQWALVFDPTRILANYHRITLIHRLTSLGFLGFLSAHIWGIL